jgi:hypothetical protein
MISFACLACSQLCELTGDMARELDKCLKCGHSMAVPAPPDCGFELAEEPEASPMSERTEVGVLCDANRSADKPPRPRHAHLIQFVCPVCSENYEAPDYSAGKREKCKTCGEVLTVPLQRLEPERVKAPQNHQHDRSSVPSGKPVGVW